MLHQMEWTVAEESAPRDDGRQMSGDDLTIADLLERNAKFDAHKRDYELPSGDFQLQPDGLFAVRRGGDGEYKLEDSALVQMAARFGQPFYGGALPRDYTKALIQNFPASYAPILNAHAAAYGKNIFLRTYADSVRGFMSDKFTHIDNADVLSILKNYLDEQNGGGYTLVRPYVGRDELNVRVLIKNIMPQGGDGAYGVGVVVRTGEIGNVSPTISPFIQRHSCTNSTVWMDGGVKLRQTGHRENKMMLLIAAMGEALQATPQLIQRMLAARYVALPRLDDIVAQLALDNDWSTEVTFNVSQGTEGQNTLFGLVNGLTSAAHKSNLSATDAIKLESMAGAWLMSQEYVSR